MDTKGSSGDSNTAAAASVDAATINEMIEVLNDGKGFYSDAAQEVSRPDLKALFGRMAEHKKQIVDELVVAVSALRETPSTSGTFAGTMRKLYAELRTRMTSDKDHEYVAQLEEFEDRILHTFEAAVTDADDDTVRSIASKYINAVRQDHDLMRDLKTAH